MRHHLSEKSLAQPADAQSFSCVSRTSPVTSRFHPLLARSIDLIAKVSLSAKIYLTSGFSRSYGMYGFKFMSNCFAQARYNGQNGIKIRRLWLCSTNFEADSLLRSDVMILILAFTKERRVPIKTYGTKSKFARPYLFLKSSFFDCSLRTSKNFENLACCNDRFSAVPSKKIQLVDEKAGLNEPLT